MSRRGEFDLIAQLFAPLSDSEHGLSLTDDAALFAPSPGHTTVLTTDTVVAGVHFLSDDPPDLVARKALRVNLSDVAAMGAVPRGYLVNLSVADANDDAWLDGFAAGLAEDNRSYGVTLYGGDTVRTPGPTTISITAIGEVRIGRALRRSGASVGDSLFVSGTIGDGIAGLRVQDLQGRLTAAEYDYLVDRYRLPQPRTTLGPRLLGLASAALDVSDGLVADLRHICDVSNVGAVVEASRVPLSTATRAAIGTGVLTLEDVLGGGDDYELLFSASPGLRPTLARLAEELGLPITEVGAVVDGKGVRVVDDAGQEMALRHAGHTHF